MIFGDCGYILLMKKTGLFLLLSLAFACQQNKAPKGIIEKDKMQNLMLDMQLTDAYLNQVYNQDTMKMQAHSRYLYVFKKHKTDSAKYVRSLEYYSKDPKVLSAMYTAISDSLTRLQTKLQTPPKAKKKKAPKKLKKATNDLSTK